MSYKVLLLLSAAIILAAAALAPDRDSQEDLFQEALHDAKNQVAVKDQQLLRRFQFPYRPYRTFHPRATQQVGRVISVLVM